MLSHLHAACNPETGLLVEAEVDTHVCRPLSCGFHRFEVQWGIQNREGQELGLVAGVLGVIPLLAQQRQSRKQCDLAAHARAQQCFWLFCPPVFRPTEACADDMQAVVPPLVFWGSCYTQ